jgi:hypothetical protein
MSTYDIGEAAKMWWNSDDYEFGTTIPAKAMSLAAFALLRGEENGRWLTTAQQDVPRLVFDLLLDRYAGHVEATNELREWCEAEGVAYQWDSWP